MHADMLRSFIRAELGELLDAERVHLAVLPHMVTVVRDARKQRIIRTRIPQARLHSEQLHEVWEANNARGAERSCGRIRQLVRSYERACGALSTDADEVAVSHLLRMDDYLIAACTFALRCAEAISETPTALTLSGILAAKQCAREALAECSARAVFRRTGESSSQRTLNRHRPSSVKVENLDNASAIFDDVRHSPHSNDTTATATSL